MTQGGSQGIRAKAALIPSRNENFVDVAHQAHAREARDAFCCIEKTPDAAVAGGRSQHERHSGEHPGGKRREDLVAGGQKRGCAAAERRAAIERRGPKPVEKPSGEDRENGADCCTHGHYGTHPCRAHALGDGMKDEDQLQAPGRQTEQVPVREETPEGFLRLDRSHEGHEQRAREKPFVFPAGK